jgi:hypothetical protein
LKLKKNDKINVNSSIIGGNGLEIVSESMFPSGKSIISMKSPGDD